MDDELSLIFAALAHPARRAIVARLREGEATVNELAGPFAMTLPAVSKHLAVLERAGLVTRSRVGQTRPCRLSPAALTLAADWLGDPRELLEKRLDRLDDHLTRIQRKESTT